MGWWQIDTATVQSVAQQLGVENPEHPHYLGDDPWNVIDHFICQVGQCFADQRWPDETEAQQIFAGTSLPPRVTALGVDVAERITAHVREMWQELECCYEEVWDRPLRPVERYCLLDYAAGHFVTPSDIPPEYLTDLDHSPPEEVRAYLERLRQDVANGMPLRIAAENGPLDVTSTRGFDQWVTRRYPQIVLRSESTNHSD